MAIREILKYPNPILRQKAVAVDDFDDSLKILAADMAETMYDAPGVGLAAPQIGILRRLIVMDVSSKDEEDSDLIVLVNPKIISAEGTTVEEEGCLSVIDCCAKVKRFDIITVAAQDLAGKHLELQAEEWFARVIQHEIDHLNGILFIDHLSSLKRALYKKQRKKQLKKEQEKKVSP